MATWGELIDRVLENLGRAGSGENRGLLFADLLELYRVDLPIRAGGHFLEGVVSVAVGGSGAPSSGEYPYPATLRSFSGLMSLDDHPPFDEGNIYTDMGRFLRDWPQFVTPPTGTPYAALVFGGSIRLRPAPVADPALTLLVAGTLYPDTTGMSEGTQVPKPNLEAALVAGATVIEAARRKREDVLSIWSDLWKSRVEGLNADARAHWRETTRGGQF